MKLIALTLVLGGALAVLDARNAEACSFAPTRTHELDPAHASDVTPPSAPSVTPTIRRWEYPSTCFDIAMIDLAVTATDDATPAERMGYQFRVIGGDPPDGLGIPDHAVMPPVIASSIGLFFDYRDTELAFDLEVRAVDLNGNVGPPSVVFIADPPPGEDDGGGGCSAGATPTSHALGSLLMLCGVLLVRRPRR